MKSHDITTELLEYTTSLVGSGQASPELATEIFLFCKSILERRNEYLVNGLAEKVDKWESAMGEDDKSLYSLGIRHSIDFVKGLEPTNAKEYKPMGEDFRPN